MASNGAGVNLDASVPPQRITCFDDTHVDAQVDSANFFEYDLHKVWGCMGRAGVNGVMRTGLVEEGGDPLNAWAPGTIESVVGGVPLAVQYWNTNVAYNPVGGIAVGDFTLYGALSPFDEVMQHLGAVPNAAPTYATEYWNGAAWTSVGALLKTPDYLQGGGFVNQRIKWTLPSNWAAATPAQLGLPGLANPGTYYYVRQYLTAALTAGPTANVAYRDWLQGHIKHFYCHYGLKRGDDTTGSAATGWYHPGDFVLRFRDGFSLEGRSTVGAGRVSWGQEFTSPVQERPTIGAGWAIVSPGKGPQIFGGMLGGGLILSRPRHDNQTMPILMRSASVPLDLHGVLMMGVGHTNGVGAAGTASVRRITNSRLCVHPAFDANPVDLGIISPYSISAASDAYVDRFVIDVRRTTTWLFGARSTVSTPTRIEGLHFTDDNFVGGGGSAQLFLSGAGPFALVDIDWGGPDLKVVSSGATEYRRLAVLVLEDGTVVPLAGIPVRIRRTDLAVVTDVLTAADGRTHAPSGAGIGLQNEDEFPVGAWLAGDGIETVNDAPYVIEVNPADHANFNPQYQSRSIKDGFPHAITFDPATSLFSEKAWQRMDTLIVVALPLKCPDPAIPGAILVDDVPMEAALTERIEAIVPANAA